MADMFADPEGWERELIDRLTRRMARRADRDQELSDDQVASMVRDTEQEIFHAAAGGADPYEGNIDIDDHSQTEGWDGEPLSDQEQMVRAIQGDEVDGHLTDRPLEFMRETELRSELERQRELNAQQSQSLATHVQRPQIEQQLAQAREQLLDAALDPDQANAHLVNYVSPAAAQHIRALEERQMNQSFDEGHRRYGEQFQEAYQNFASQDPNSASAQRAWDYVRSAPSRGEDQAEALMRWHDNPGFDSTIGSRQPAPFEAGARRASPNRNRQPTYDEMAEADGGFGSEQVEGDVFASAFDGYSHGRR